MNYRIHYSNELYHYGVKGMKWGVRKDERVSSAESSYTSAKASAKQARKDASSFSRRHVISSRIKGSKNHQKVEELRRSANDKSNEVSKAKDKLDSTKNLVKTEHYRDRLARRAKARADWEKESAKEHQRNIDDLKKNGDKSEVYKRQMNKDLNAQKRKFEEKYGEDSYHAFYAWADAIAYDRGSKQRVSDLMNNEKSARNAHIYEARKYVRKSKTLMETPVNELMTKKDVRKIYKNS